MPFHGAYDESLGILVFLFEGVASAGDVEPFTKEAVRLADEHRCLKMLSDFRGARLGLSTSGIFKLTEIFQASGIDETWKRAILVNRQGGDYVFHEKVARGRGHKVRVFADEEDALNWLNWEPTTEEQLGPEPAG